ncbi:MAG: hypothetical protein IPI46_06445 [Bacteroidetes bacterium]|nr:hypothetical protein [Bacteroidota bacterium]
MKKIISCTAFLIFSLSAFSQQINKSELIGKWRVVSAESTLGNLIPEEFKSTLDSLMKGIMIASFEFEENGKFNFNFGIQEMAIQNAHWKIDSKSNSIVVQEWADKDKEKSKLMEISIEKEKDKTYFLPIETFFKLEMKKD